MVCKNDILFWGSDESECAKEDCLYYVDGACKLKEMDEIMERINKLFPNVQCYVDDGYLQIWFDVVDSAENRGPFKQAGTVLLNPKDGGKAIVAADIMDYDDPTKDVPRVHPGQCPVQKYMIDPERFVW